MTRKVFLEGEQVVYWSDDRLPFECKPQDIAQYAQAGQWVHAFNALVLMNASVQAVGS